MGIPKIIHQTWKTREIPNEWKEFHQTWGEYNPDWQHIIWTDEDCLQFVYKHFPEFLNTFTSYSYNIQRADAFRYLVLYLHGGLYVDLDFECLRPVDDLVVNRSFVIGKEPRIHAKWHGAKVLISNAFMASVPGHPFLLEIIETMKKMNPRSTSHREVLETTGPLMVTNVLNNYSGKDICVLNAHILYPFASNKKEMCMLRNKKGDYLRLKKQCRENETYGIHYWSNTWARTLAGQLINPDPFSVEGYQFYPGMDSRGYDISNMGRDISRLAVECENNEKAMGFNTDGFLKYNIRPMCHWVEVENWGGNEGLYVKKRLLSKLRLHKKSVFRTVLGFLGR